MPLPGNFFANAIHAGTHAVKAGVSAGEAVADVAEVLGGRADDIQPGERCGPGDRCGPPSE